MVKRVVFLSIVVAVLVAIPAAQKVWGKAHVPMGRAQICTSGGTVKNVSGRALSRRLGEGACRLTACVFDDFENGTLITQYIFLPGEDCDNTDLDGDDFCDAVGRPKDIPKRLKAINVTPACTLPF